MEGIFHGPGRHKKVTLTLFFGDDKTVPAPCTPEGACDKAHLLGQTVSMVLEAYDSTFLGKAPDETLERLFLSGSEAEDPGEFAESKRFLFSLENREKGIFGEVGWVFFVFHVSKVIIFSFAIVGRTMSITFSLAYFFYINTFIAISLSAQGRRETYSAKFPRGCYA
jgi:hypothetical protein